MIKRKLFAAVAFLFVSAVSFAQTQPSAPVKIGYTNVDYVMSQMPESKQIEADLKAYSAQLEAQLKSKYSEFETKGQAYQKGAATMTDVVKADKEKELMNLRTSIEEFQKNADASLQKKQQQLMEPVLDKLQKAIDAVALENGYTYVFNSDAGYGTTPVLLHGPDDGNISDLVLKKMGVTPGQKPADIKPSVNPTPVTNPATTPTKGKSKTKKK
jgi:outer membrane protein